MDSERCDPRSIQTFSADYADPQKDRLHTITEEVLSARGLSPENTLEYTYLTFAAVRQEDTFSLDNSNSLSLLGSIYSLNFVLLDDYNRLTGSDQSLESDELLLCSPLEELPEVLTFGQREFRVKGQGEEFLSDSSRNASVSGGLLLVVRDLPVLEDLYRMQQEVYGENASAIQLYYGFDLNTDKETLLSVYQQLSDEMKQAGLIAGRLDCGKSSGTIFFPCTAVCFSLVSFWAYCSSWPPSSSSITSRSPRDMMTGTASSSFRRWAWKNRKSAAPSILR